MSGSQGNSICPHLGIHGDPTVTASIPTKLHRCYLPKRHLSPEMSHQESYCLRSDHVNCPIYQSALASSLPDAQVVPAAFRLTPKTRPSRFFGYVAGAIILLVLAAVAYQAMGAMIADRGQTVLVTIAAQTTAETEPTVAAAITAAPVLAQSTPTPTAVNDAAVAMQSAPPALASARFMTPTPEPGGEVILLRAKDGEAGWWSNESALPNHLGDSFLYAGNFEGQTYIAGVRFDLSHIPRGAPILYAQLRLTGLRDDRLGEGVEGTWLVQLLPESSLTEITDSDFLTFYSAPASITLLPELKSADVGQDVVNSWTLDEPVRQWIAQQLLDGATSVTVRISAATQNGETLFAWDSGLGPETAGDAATLLLSIGSPPPTPPPLPTRPLIVATLTPVPANVMTVVAHAVTATAEAYSFGTSTPFPFQVVTPTPFPENLATVQAIAVAEELPPVLLNTPVPANQATALFNEEYATAVALTTGTFTPVPPNYITPMIVYPSPPAENVATAAARVVQATAAAANGDATPTPLPRNAVMAVYAFATETPSSMETAIAMVNEQNAAAATTGTPTPTPWNLVVITAVPQPTPTEIPPPTALPLSLPADVVTPTPTPTATRVLTVADLEQFRGKVLFLSDRSGSDQVWVMDPESGQVLSLITDSHLMDYARDQMLTFSPDRREQAVVLADGSGDLQIQVLSVEYGSTEQITHFRDKISYDPAWSPLGDQIAFVSTNSGNDEIYLVDRTGRVVQQLTHNIWEWDKHPSWSPDGSRIVFYSNRDSGRTQIWIMNADGSGQLNLSNNEYNDWDPIWIR